jgi:hypothetical protein
VKERLKMAIQSIGSSTTVDSQSMLKRMEANTTPPAKPSGPPPGAKTASKSTESSSSTTTNYDERDTNKDGTVSSQEKLQYALKLLEERRQKQAETQSYNQLGQPNTVPGNVINTFMVNA